MHMQERHIKAEQESRNRWIDKWQRKRQRLLYMHTQGEKKQITGEAQRNLKCSGTQQKQKVSTNASKKKL